MNDFRKIIVFTLLVLFFSVRTEGAVPQNDFMPALKKSEQKRAQDSPDFNNGYKYFKEKRYWEASPYLYSYLRNNSPDDVDYEWAEFFFGISLKKVGFSHASVDVLSHLVKRKPNPKIVSYTLELFEKITRTTPFDQDLITHEVLSDHEYGFVDENLSNFVNFYQGVFDWEHGFLEWGSEHFEKIMPGTYYFYKALYQNALYSIYQGKIDEGIEVLKKILKDLPEEDNFKDEVRKTLARLFYEKGQYEEAVFMYQQIRKPVPDQAQNLLERAWVHYQRGDNEKAMGLLYAFTAPSFQKFFTPEYFVLKSFIYKAVCHYKRVLSVVEEFNNHYGSSLKTIYNRGKAVDNHALLLVILNKKRINETWKFLALLEREREQSKKLSNKALYDYIDEIYDLQIQKTAAVFKKLVEEEYEKMANDLLKYEEQTHLMEYEIGLDMYQRVHQFHYREDDAVHGDKQDKKGKVAFPFQGEFWIDEMDDYKVTLSDKCENAEEWDIFLK